MLGRPDSNESIFEKGVSALLLLFDASNKSAKTQSHRLCLLINFAFMVVVREEWKMGIVYAKNLRPR
jgi:hypothetical protein